MNAPFPIQSGAPVLLPSDPQSRSIIAFADVSDHLVEMVTDLNETDGTNKINGWRAVAVNVTLAEGK